MNISYHIYKKYFSVESTSELKKKALAQNPFFESFDAFKTFYNMNTEYFVKLGFIFVDTFTSPLNPVFKRKFDDDGCYILIVNEEFVEEVRQNLIISPQSLPMISKPAL